MLKNKVKKARILILVIVALVCLGVVIKKTFFSPSFTYAGTLEATKVDLSSRLSSVLADVRVQEGDQVREGDALVFLDCDDLKVAADLANINFNRNTKLYKAGTVSQENRDLVKNRKEESDVRMNWCKIRSPIQGRVLSRYREPGEWVSPGTKLLTLANIRDIWTFIYVPQPEVSKLKVGQTLIGVLPELDHKEFTGRIIKINDEAEFTPKNVQTRAERTRLVYGVKISFLGSNNDEVLKPGMTIEVTLPKE